MTDHWKDAFIQLKSDSVKEKERLVVMIHSLEHKLEAAIGAMTELKEELDYDPSNWKLVKGTFIKTLAQLIQHKEESK